MTTELFHPELRGVYVGETDICQLDGGFGYRGYDVAELAQGGGFLEAAYLLLNERLPGGEELADFRSLLLEAAEPSATAEAVLEALPMSAAPLDALRAAFAALAVEDWTPEDASVDANRARAVRLIAQTPLLAAAALRPGSRPRFDAERSFAANVMWLLGGPDPSSLQERAVETTLTLLAEHEMNAATFAARVVASTGADVYGSAAAALAAAGGHGSTADVEDWFQGMLEVASPDGAEEFVDRMIARSERETGRAHAPGFGHPVYEESDPRATMLERVCEDLATASGHDSLEDVARAVESAVWVRTGLPPNVEWPRRRLMHYVGLPAEASTLMFVCGRVVGWCVNAIEQQEEGTTYRPRARYRGAEGLSYVPLGDSGRSL